jgi:hypothetical protein
VKALALAEIDLHEPPPVLLLSMASTGETIAWAVNKGGVDPWQRVKLDPISFSWGL